MTMETVSSTGGQNHSYQGLVTGHEDFDSADLKLPRLKILHPEGMFQNVATEETIESLECIVLCVVKQRVMFPEVYTGEDGAPECKSNDDVIGFPGKDFPWNESNRNIDILDVTDKGNQYMECEGCLMASWGRRDPKTGKSKPPRCSQLHTYAILYYSHLSQSWEPATISFKSSSLKPSSSYTQPFITGGRPFFTVTTRIDLTKARRGTTSYSIAKFTTTGQTDSTLWGGYSNQSVIARSFLREEPELFVDDEDEASGTQAPADNSWNQAPDPPRPAPAPRPAPSATVTSPPPPAPAPAAPPTGAEPPRQGRTRPPAAPVPPVSGPVHEAPPAPSPAPSGFTVNPEEELDDDTPF